MNKEMEKIVKDLELKIAELTVKVQTLTLEVEQLKRGEHYTGVYMEGAPDYVVDYIRKEEKKEGDL